MRTTKKITSIVLAVLMVVSMMSVMAVTASATTNVAKVGGTEYETLQAAFDNATAGDTVELLTDITLEPQTISGESAKYGAYITKSITFDGKGHTISSNAPRAIGVKGSGSKVNVTFKDVTVKINNNPSNAICICTRGGIGELTLDNVTLDTQGCNKAYNQPLTIGGTQYDQAKVTVKNGSVIQTNNEASKYYAIILWNPVDLTIQSSTIKGWACVYQKPFEAGTTDTTEVKIDNSTLISKGLAGSTNHFAAIMTEEEGFSCEVTNSNINVTAAENTYQGVVASNGSADGFKVELGEGNNVSMTGDTAIIGYNFDETNHEISVSGGSFNKPVDEEYLSNTVDTHDNGNGTYIVSSSGKTYVARVGSQGYETLQAAIDAAPAGATVKLVDNITISTGMSVPGESNSLYGAVVTKDITIDGNGHSVDFTTKRGFGVKGASSAINVTFKDITINNNVAEGRAIDTRGNISSLTLNGATLYTPTGGSKGSQALTIGGNQSTSATVNIKDSKLEARYAITTFNPVNMTIDDSKITGWACLNIKAESDSEGSHGSKFTVKDSTLNSLNPFAGATNAYALIKIEDDDVDVNITGSTLNITGDQNNQAIVACEDLSGHSTTDNMVTLGEGNTVNFSGDTSFVSVEPTDSEGMVISGGTFSEPVPEDLCAPTFVPTPKDPATGMYTVVVDNNPLNPLKVSSGAISDGNAFEITGVDYLKGALLGVQKKDKASVAAPATSVGNQEGEKNMRFIAVLDTNIINNLGPDDDYGFVLAKVSGSKTSVNFDNLKANWGNGEKTISARGTYNNVCGDKKYGDPDDPSTDYKYVTCAVNDVDQIGTDKIVARFYVKINGQYYYAKYSKNNYNPGNTGILVGWNNLVDA